MRQPVADRNHWFGTCNSDRCILQVGLLRARNRVKKSTLIDNVKYKDGTCTDFYLKH